MSTLTPRIDRLEKNYIINGDMRISQRGTSFVAIANSAYCLDRWSYNKVGTTVHTVTQDTDVPTFAQANYLFQNSLRLNLTTPDTAIATGDFCFMSQYIEGYNWTNLAQKQFTVSFWVKATTAGVYCVGIKSAGNDRSYVAEYTINASATWEYKTVTVAASPSAGTWNYSNGIGLQVYFVLAAGATYQTSPGSWQTGNFFATSNQVNGVNTGATDFRITGVMISEGASTGSRFSTFGKDFISELNACRRYYEAQDTNHVGVVTDARRYLVGRCVTTNTTTTATVFFQTPKRASPSVTAPGAAGNWRAYPTSGAVQVPSAVSVSLVGLDGAQLNFTISAGATADTPVAMFYADSSTPIWIATSEL